MNRKTTKKVDESTLTTFCQTRYGFDYYVQPIVRKSKMTGKENRRETEPA